MTVINASKDLVYPGAPAKFQNAVQKKLKAKGVKLILGVLYMVLR